MTLLFSAAEEAELLRGLRDGTRQPPCPRCGTVMSRREVPPHEGVAYVRERVWLVCGGCSRSVVIDRRKIEREDPGTSG